MNKTFARCFLTITIMGTCIIGAISGTGLAQRPFIESPNAVALVTTDKRTDLYGDSLPAGAVARSKL